MAVRVFFEALELMLICVTIMGQCYIYRAEETGSGRYCVVAMCIPLYFVVVQMFFSWHSGRKPKENSSYTLRNVSNIVCGVLPFFLARPYLTAPESLVLSPDGSVPLLLLFRVILPLYHVVDAVVCTWRLFGNKGLATATVLMAIMLLLF